MAIEIVTIADLQKFKNELFDELKMLFGDQPILLENKKWLKNKEVMRMLNISQSTLQTFRSNGTIPFTKIGSTLYYDKLDILKLLDENKILRNEVNGAKAAK
jgi:hypothetical protein